VCGHPPSFFFFPFTGQNVIEEASTEDATLQEKIAETTKSAEKMLNKRNEKTIQGRFRSWDHYQRQKLKATRTGP